MPVKNIMLKESNVKNKRYAAILFNERGSKIKTINFGSANHENFTIHKDEERKERYLKRHSKENWSEINPGSLARFLLWNKKSLKASISDLEKRFKVKVTLI